MIMRKLRAEDIPALGELFERNNVKEVTVNFNPFPLTRQTAGKLLAHPSKDLYFGAFEEKVLIAFSMLRGWEEGFEIPSFGILVDGGSRGTGVGRKLTDWTLKMAGELGCLQVRLTVFEANRPARHIYEKNGFKVTASQIDEAGCVRLTMHKNMAGYCGNQLCAEIPPGVIPVYVSTQCLPAEEELRDRLTRLYDAGLTNIELSGYPVEDNAGFLKWVVHFPGQLMLHHFFPAESERLILNLASPDVARRRETLRFYRRGIEWSVACRAKFYSIHAGYVVDPIGRDTHGFIFPEPSCFARRAAQEAFCDSLCELADYAREYKIEILVENNVLAAHHKNKLLLSTPDDFSAFFDHWPDARQVGLLLDWGHWKITARTMGLNLEAFLPLKKWIRGFHMHDNDGIADCHAPFSFEEDAMQYLAALDPAYITLEGHYQDIHSLSKAVKQAKRHFIQKKW